MSISIMSSQPSSALDWIQEDLDRVLEVMRGDDAPQPNVSLDVAIARADCDRARRNYGEAWDEFQTVWHNYQAGALSLEDVAPYDATLLEADEALTHAQNFQWLAERFAELQVAAGTS